MRLLILCDSHEPQMSFLKKCSFFMTCVQEKFFFGRSEVISWHKKTCMLHISLIDIDHNHLATRCLNYIDSPLPRCQLSRTGTLCAAGSKHLQIRFTSITRTTQTIIRMFITWVLKTCLIEKNTHHFLKPKFRKLQDDSKNASPSLKS